MSSFSKDLEKFTMTETLQSLASEAEKILLQTND